MIDYHRIKAICCNTDGALYSDDGTVSEENRKWIEKVGKEKGVLFFENPPENKDRFLFSVSREYGIPISEICAVGSELGDLPMFDKAGVRIAMADSPEQLFMSCDFITASNNADGIARIIKRLFYDIEDEDVILRFVR